MKKPNLSLSLLKEKCKKFKENKDIKKRSLIILTFSVFISFLFVSLITYGATTIGSNINTEGTLIVQGRINGSSTLQATGAARFYSTARIDGATILNSVSYVWPSSDGSASTYLQTNGAGTLSWATVSSGSSSDWLKQTNFGVLNLTASTTIPYWAKDAIYASSTLQVQGLTTLTNASTTQTSVSSNFYTALTANSIPFIGTNGLLTQNNSNLIWDNTNTRLGIGTTTPNWLLQVAGTRPFLTLSDTGASANNKHWFLSSQGGNFYVGTSSDALNATSTYLRIETDISGTALTSLGAFTFSSNTTGASSTAIGFQSLQSNTTGDRNTAVGALALQKNTTGLRNSALGYKALNSNTTAYSNTAVGYEALFSNTSGTYNTAVGYEALRANTSGQRNVSVGYQSLDSNTTAADNTAIGNNALTSNTTGASLTAVGRLAGFKNTTGSFNTYIGYDTGSSSVATLTYATAIGAGTQVNRSSSLILGGESNTTYAVNVGIGTTTPNWLLQAAGTRPFLTLSDTIATTDQKHWFLSSQGGNFYVGTSSDALNATSTSNLLNLISSNYSVGIGTTSPAEQFSVSGRLFVGGTGTSTIQNNLYVIGTLRSTVSYVGDLVFSNNFRFIESQPNEKIQSLFLNNQYGENIFKINEKGRVVVREIEAENIQTKNIEAEKGNFKEGSFEEKLKTKELQIGSPQNRTGITIYDKKTGKPYCLEINDGKVINKEGECK